jgi:hypothetical protein
MQLRCEAALGIENSKTGTCVPKSVAIASAMGIYAKARMAAKS